jgi:hypothetical protein
MKKTAFLVAMLLALMAALALVAGPAAAPVLAGNLVPFKGHFEGVTTSFVPGVTGADIHVSAQGRSSHLGRLSLEIPHRLTFGDPETVDGVYEFTAANRDHLFADFAGESSPDAPPGFSLFLVTATMTGGTGRFENASGDFSAKVLVDLATGNASGKFIGQLSRP